MELIGEIYATQGKFLAAPPEELRSAISNNLQLLEKAGKEIVMEMKLSVTTEKMLKKANEGFNAASKGL